MNKLWLAAVLLVGCAVGPSSGPIDSVGNSFESEVRGVVLVDGSFNDTSAAGTYSPLADGSGTSPLSSVPVVVRQIVERSITNTDQNGEYKLPVTLGTQTIYSYAVRSDGKVYAAANILEVASSTELTFVTTLLTPANIVNGRVTGDTGDILGAVSVRGLDIFGPVDNQGNFALNAIPDGSWTLDYHSLTHAGSLDIEVAGGKIFAATITVSTIETANTGVVEGCFGGLGSELGSVAVYQRELETIFALPQDGCISLRLPDGANELVVVRPGEASFVVTVNAVAGEESSIQIDLPANQQVRQRVAGRAVVSGIDIDDIVVSVTPGDFDVTVDDNGNFNFDAPPGCYTISISANASTQTDQFVCVGNATVNIGTVGVVANASCRPAEEVCDEVDNNCNGSVDEDLLECQTCVPSMEVCDGIDNDCDGIIDQDTVTTYYVDQDGDDFGTNAIDHIGCSEAPATYSTNEGDCDDTDADEYPGQLWYQDTDGDGYSDGVALTACNQPATHMLIDQLSGPEVDCQPNNIEISPAATEVCDAFDNNCDGTINENAVCRFQGQYGERLTTESIYTVSGNNQIDTIVPSAAFPEVYVVERDTSTGLSTFHTFNAVDFSLISSIAMPGNAEVHAAEISPDGNTIYFVAIDLDGTSPTYNQRSMFSWTRSTNTFSSVASLWTVIGGNSTLADKLISYLDALNGQLIIADNTNYLADFTPFSPFGATMYAITISNSAIAATASIDYITITLNSTPGGATLVASGRSHGFASGEYSYLNLFPIANIALPPTQSPTSTPVGVIATGDGSMFGINADVGVTNANLTTFPTSETLEHIQVTSPELKKACKIVYLNWANFYLCQNGNQDLEGHGDFYRAFEINAAEKTLTHKGSVKTNGVPSGAKLFPALVAGEYAGYQLDKNSPLDIVGVKFQDPTF